MVIVPTVEFPPVIPFTFHVMAVLDVFCTVAVNARVLLMRTEAVVGEIVTLTGGGTGVMVTEAVPFAEVSAWLVA